MTDSFMQTQKPLVLVADDDATMRVMMREILENAGFEILETKDGREALTAFVTHSPDAVLLDVDMPEVDGFGVCSEIRRSEHGQFIPVLVVTGLDDLNSVNRAYDAGATDFISKPINWSVLGHRVRYMLRASKAFREQKLAARLGRVLDRSSNEIYVFEADSLKFSQVNSGARENLGFSMEELSQLTPLDVKPEYARQEFQALLDSLRKGLDDQICIQTVHQRKDGSVYPVEERVSISRQETPPVLVAIVQDISERKRAEEQMRYLAYYDSLTGLPNRRLFGESLAHAIELANRHQQLLAILFIDLDRFKRINDTLGHRVGDLLLKSVAERLAECLRSSDTLARWDAQTEPVSVARLGGDEFTVTLNSIAQAEEAVSVAQRILTALSEPFVLDGHEIVITPSIGISLYPADGDNADLLLKNADLAMYHAKEEGRNNYRFYTNTMNATAMERLELESRLRNAAERNELLLHYQPQLDVETGQIVGTEALVRWQNPDLGIVQPAKFIPLAEETGLIVALGEWVLRTACRQNKVWQQAGLRPIKLAVNVSNQQIRQPDFRDKVARTLADTGLDPTYLEIELTESTIMRNANETVSTLLGLKEMGVGLSVDDFGTAYSSLSYLKRFPLDTVKIDRSFVQDVTTDAEDAAIVSAIVAMAKSLKLRTIAEGVETQGQLEFLKQQGTRFMQGYLFSEPLTAEAFGRLLEKQLHWDQTGTAQGM